MKIKPSFQYLFALCLSCFSLFSFAHPHAFIDLKTQVIIQQNQLVGFKTDWLFDELNSADILYEYKNSKNKAQTREAIRKDLMNSISAEHFFSYLYENKKTVKLKNKVEKYDFSFIGNKLLFSFQFNLAKPIPLTNNKFTLFTYDPSYYVEMRYQKKSDISSNHSACSVKLIEPVLNRQLKTYASGLDKETNTDNMQFDDQSLGANFAQQVEILCKK